MVLLLNTTLPTTTICRNPKKEIYIFDCLPPVRSAAAVSIYLWVYYYFVGSPILEKCSFSFSRRKKTCRVWGEENLQISQIFKEICCQWNVIELPPPPPLTVNIAWNVFSPPRGTDEKSCKWTFVFRRKKFYGVKKDERSQMKLKQRSTIFFLQLLWDKGTSCTSFIFMAWL